MKPLLKDLPGFSERIEGNFGLADEVISILSDIEIENEFDEMEDDIISDIVNVLESCTEFRIVDGRVEIGDKQALAIQIFKSLLPMIQEDVKFTILNDKEISTMIVESITNFVNENYQIK